MQLRDIPQGKEELNLQMCPLEGLIQMFISVVIAEAKNYTYSECDCKG